MDNETELNEVDCCAKCDYFESHDEDEHYCIQLKRYVSVWNICHDYQDRFGKGK